MVTVDPRDPIPLWRQIEDAVRNLVVTGGLPAGAPVPSVRELARDLTVNPATVSRAYQRLSEAGVLEVRRGEGTFVATRPPSLPAAARRERLESEARRLAALARSLGAVDDEAHDALAAAFAALEEETR